MKIFKDFYFEKYEFDLEEKKAYFYYSFDEKYNFQEVIDFWSDLFEIRKDLDFSVLDNLLFHLHIALWISYYKAFPTKNLYVKSGFLNDDQISFWKKFYINWLWEFLYKNNISHIWLFNFLNKGWLEKNKKEFKLSNKALIPIWWWKDSLVSIDLFKKNNLDFDLYVFWKSDNIKESCADIIWKDILLTKRKISDNLLKLNELWNYNWHVPITWIISFSMLVVWYIYDYRYLVLSNEKSANSENRFFNWLKVNHQYSKSLEYEKDLSIYIEKYISSDLKYFSLLRWFYEVKIAKYFSENCLDYFKVFSSCNNNFQIDETKRLRWTLWCNNCPKCAFVFSILRPYLRTNDINLIFWEDLFLKDWLYNTFLDLLWYWEGKPFECVWEEEEVVFWMYKSLSFYNWNSKIINFFLENIRSKFTNLYFNNLEKKFDTIYDDTIIPREINDKILKH